MLVASTILRIARCCLEGKKTLPRVEETDVGLEGSTAMKLSLDLLVVTRASCSVLTIQRTLVGRTGAAGMKNALHYQYQKYAKVRIEPSQHNQRKEKKSNVYSTQERAL